MSSLLFDTLRLSRTLRDKGHFTPEQAETLAEALGEAQHGDLATKADMAALEVKIDKVEAALEVKIDKVAAALEAKIGMVEATLEAKIGMVEATLEAKIGMVEAKIGLVESKIGFLATRSELADVRADILKWIVGAIGFQTVVMVGALITLVRIFAR